MLSGEIKDLIKWNKIKHKFNTEKNINYAFCIGQQNVNYYWYIWIHWLCTQKLPDGMVYGQTKAN